jgi:hypothetical protein
VNELELLLARWANFYLSMSAAAASLIGLLFVVITFASASANEEDAPKIRAYLTPTVVYFASLLLFAAFLTFANHTRFATSLCLCLGGVGGLVYSASKFIGGKTHYPGWHDVIVYAILPSAAYGFVVWGGVLVLSDPQRGLTVVAVGMLSLLTIGIRNSWSIVISVVFMRHHQP